MKHCAVIGVGSSHGEDQLGWLVVESLQQILGERESIVYVLCDRTVFDWMLLKQMDQCLFVDAVVSGAKPGTLHQIDLNSGEAEASRSASSHGFSLLDAVALARSLGQFPDHAMLYGIEIGQWQPQGAISTEVRQAIPLCVSLLKRVLLQGSCTTELLRESFVS